MCISIDTAKHQHLLGQADKGSNADLIFSFELSILHSVCCSLFPPQAKNMEPSDFSGFPSLERFSTLLEYFCRPSEAFFYLIGAPFLVYFSIFPLFGALFYRCGSRQPCQRWSCGGGAETRHLLRLEYLHRTGEEEYPRQC